RGCARAAVETGRGISRVGVGRGGGDHFAGGTGTPQPDGTLAYAHTNCSTLTACPANQIGEVNANLPPLMPAGTPSFAVHSDDAPTVYVAGNPPRSDAAVR